MPRPFVAAVSSAYPSASAVARAANRRSSYRYLQLLLALMVACSDQAGGQTGGRHPGSGGAGGGGGDAGELLILTESPFQVAAPSDFDTNPKLGATTSQRHLMLALSADVQKQAFEDLLDEASCAMAGVAPWLGMVQIDCGEGSSFDKINRAFELFDSSPLVETVAYDTLIMADRLPPAVDAGTILADEGIQWSYSSAATWGLRDIAAPSVWNLRSHLDENGAPTTEVAVLDVGYWQHPALPPGSYDFIDNVHGYHGTQMALFIGGLWNKTAADGISPYVSVTGYAETADEGFEISGTPMASFLNELVVLQDGLLTAPARVVSISLGYNWYQRCHSYQLADETTTRERCDPRDDPGVRVPDGTHCDPAAVQDFLIARQGLLFGRLASALQGQTLFVVSAGNDSGGSTNIDVCGSCGDPFACAGSGMGLFPAQLSSPFAWAAKNGWAEDVIAVEASDESGARASFSGVDGDVLAPGAKVGVPGKNWGEAEWTLGLADGTSYATPMVAGSASFLLTLEPTLTNSELRTLLISPPFAQPADGAGSTTSTRPHLLGAVIGIEELRGTGPGPISRMLADMDDGSPDGFTRDEVVFENGAFTYLGYYESDEQGDGKVDFRDFRRLRDSWHRAALIDHIANPKLDLNENATVEPVLVTYDETVGAFVVDTSPLSGEIYARAAISGGAHPRDKFSFGGAQIDSLDVLERTYLPSPEEPWDKDDLRTLLASADIHFFADDIAAVLSANGAVAIEITQLSGAPASSLPANLSPITNVVLDGTSDRVMTTPFLTDSRVHWRLLFEDGVGEERVSDAMQLVIGEDWYFSFAEPSTSGQTHFAISESWSYPQDWFTPEGYCQPATKSRLATAVLSDFQYDGMQELIGWRLSASDHIEGTSYPASPDCEGPSCNCELWSSDHVEERIYSRAPGCSGMWVEGQVIDGGTAYIIIPHCDTVARPWVNSGHCIGGTEGGPDIEHWGLSGVTHTHSFDVGMFQHTCTGPQCRPLHDIALEGPQYFTSEVEACFCEWGYPYFPGQLPFIPTWCGGPLQTQPTTELLTWVDQSHWALQTYVPGYNASDWGEIVGP